MNYQYDLFVSFADEDQGYALKLCEALAAHDLKVWCSAKDVKINGNIHREVSHALAASKFFLPVISKHYQREWHKIEFHNAAHDKPLDCIIPLAYGVGYGHIKQQAMFSLILTKKPIIGEKYALKKTAMEINAIITQRPMQDTRSLTAKVRDRLTASLLNPKVIVSFTVIPIVIFMYHFAVNTASNIEEVAPKEATQANTSTPSIAIDLNNPNFDKLRVINVDSSRSEDYLSAEYKGLFVLSFVLFNEGNKDITIDYIRVEVKRNSPAIFEENMASLETNTLTGKTPVFFINIPQTSINMHHYYPLEPAKICPKNKHLVIPIVFCQRKNGKYVLPDGNVEFTLQFISKERIYAQSKRFYFEDKLFYSEEYQ